MHRKSVLKVARWLTISFLYGSVLNQTVMADNLITNTKVDKLGYQSLYQGKVEVVATLFNAPCSLSFKAQLTLTNCGAGDDFSEMNIFDVTANTPVTVQFFDAKQKLSSARYPLSILNGNNPLHLPVSMQEAHTLRLEVNYE